MFNDSLMTRSSLKILKTICSTGIQSVGVAAKNKETDFSEPC